MSKALTDELQKEDSLKRKNYVEININVGIEEVSHLQSANVPHLKKHVL